MDVNKLLWSTLTGLVLAGNPLFAQNKYKLGDNMGSHTASKDLNLQNHNLTGASLINSKGLLVGTATTLSNTSIVLQVDGVDKAILIPRVSDLLNATTPSIPAANAINGMVVYDMATGKFYYRQNNVWAAYMDAIVYVDRFLPDVVLGRKIFKSDSGFVARGTLNAGIIPATGAGARMMWYPGKGAFRAGYANATTWEDNVIGANSVAMGEISAASGIAAVALGHSNTASGNYSVAIGYGAVSSGLNAIGFGMLNLASGNYSTVMGRNSVASGIASFALGANLNANRTGSFLLGDYSASSTTLTGSSADNRFQGRFAGGYEFYTASDLTRSFYANPDGVLKYQGDYSATYDDRSMVDKNYLDTRFLAKPEIVGGHSGVNSFAFGQNTDASGQQSFAFGLMSTASGNNTIAGGYFSVANGAESVALGRNARTNVARSVALGTSVTTGGAGSFLFGDGYTNVLTSAADEWNLRFAGGYRFFTSESVNVGMMLPSNANGWSAMSDKRKKENFETIDAESFLLKIDTMQLSSWNYKEQDAKKNRHYGPMAQDFFGAFGKDSYGTIGCDTLIGQTDFDGVNLIAIKGLVNRAKKIAKENESLARKIMDLQSEKNRASAAMIEKMVNRLIEEKETKKGEVGRFANYVEPKLKP